ncbi:M48 family metallopeptidase [Nitratiruptor sp. SB155-2]|uniref:M48 family metallopeptidase n=1 Tax=Nitratiruptor sp. (strain SB155-2) TaxID=387092 RepID=UPI000158734A|nr:M48 family metallopeptidase [Nitratiruptor sp. SB155-2]BAF70147.1 zinc-metallo protease [Nitratiruptor sp. SB155-2]
MLGVSILYGIYILVKLYVSVMQAGFVAKAKHTKAVLMLPSKFIKAGRYSFKKERIAILETFIEYILFLFWMGFGLRWLDTMIQIDDILIKSVVYIDLFFAINYLVTLPFDIYQKFVLDEEFGFNKSTISLFIKDQIKMALLFLVFASILVYIVGWIMLHVSNWWIWGFVFIFSVIILINAIYPTLIAPMFNKFTPLQDEELKKDIEELMAKSGFRANGVYVVDSSKRDTRLNAYFGGLGKSKRVVLFDTLIDKLSKKELLAVLGHELGHFKHKDILKNIVMMGVMFFALFYIFANLPASLYEQAGIPPHAPYSVIAMFLLLSPVFFFFFMPLINFVSRKNEFAADRYGSELGGRANLRNALLKLVEENSHFPLSHPLYIFFYYSHPPILERLKALGFEETSEADEALRGKCVSIDEDR